MMKKFLITNLFATTVFCFFSQSAFAAPGYLVSPLVIDITAEARDILTRSISITNTGTQPVTIFPTVSNISLEDGKVINIFVSPAGTDRTQTLSSWLEFSRRGINLAMGASTTLPITLRVNPNPVPGVYHAFIGFGYGRNVDEAETMVKNGKAPGTIFTVKIKDNKIEFLKLSGFVVDRFVTNINNNAATYTFKNPGSETLVPKGEIIFYDNTGKEVASVAVNDENVAIAPGGEHVFETTVPVSGLFGKYKAFLSVEYGITQRASVQDTSFFYILPFNVIIMILGLVLFMVAMIAWKIHTHYFDEVVDDSERLSLHIRDGKSSSLHHDIDLKNRNDT